MTPCVLALVTSATVSAMWGVALSPLTDGFKHVLQVVLNATLLSAWIAFLLRVVPR